MARVMTSLIFIARSKTRVGYKCIRDTALRMLLSQNPASQTGHFICYSHRTHHVLPTQKLGPLAAIAHPTYDHFLPILYALGLQTTGDEIRSFCDGFQYKS